MTAAKLKSNAEADGSELAQKLVEAASREAELAEKCQQALKRAMQAEQASIDAQAAYKEANAEFKIEEVAEAQKVKDPLDMSDKLDARR